MPGWGYRLKYSTPLICSIKALFKSMSCQPLIRKNSYLNHNFPVGLAFIPCHRTPGSMLWVGAKLWY